MSSAPKVWFVDDIQSNLDEFKADHAHYLNVEIFLDPSEVLERLKTETPDALFCDLFFYDTPEQALEIEEKINKKANELREFANQIGAINDKYLAGLHLIKEVSKEFSNKFPVYAYTSKGPYLLEGSALKDLAETNTPIVYKGRYSRPVERFILARDIREFKQRNSISSKIARYILPVLIGWGVMYWFVAKLLDYLWLLVSGT